MKDRVKVMFTGTAQDSETSEHALIAPNGNATANANPAMPTQALHVLTLAQRTAEEHVANAQRQADKIRADALAAADQIARDAQVHAHNVRREADKVVFEARAAAEQAARDEQSRAEEAQRSVEKVVADAQARAESIAAEARANADQLRAQAQQRYDDIVGSLGTKRAALQQQIEALEHFDQEYRARLTRFMQGQLRALWVDQPQVAGELEPVEPLQFVEQAPPADAERAEDEYADADVPPQRQGQSAEQHRQGQSAEQHRQGQGAEQHRQGQAAEPQPVGVHAAAEE
jgi:cell division septum initiation protein DivIVA